MLKLFYIVEVNITHDKNDRIAVFGVFGKKNTVKTRFFILIAKIARE